MRYKNLVTTKLEQLQNQIVLLQSMLSQGSTRYQVEEWINQMKEKIDEAQTLVNSEHQD